jgi:GNAT superfamily N-acetyltransferase
VSQAGIDVTLADATRLRLRPLVPEDKAALQAGLDRMSPESRYNRFFTAMARLSPTQLAYFTEIDYVDHFAWGAFALDDPDSPGVGVGRYVRSSTDPTVADFALAVADDYQGRGVGRLLVRALVVVARENGIERFVAYVLATNSAMTHLVHGLGGRVVFDGDGLMRAEVSLPDVGEEPASGELYDLVRQVASAKRGISAADPAQRATSAADPAQRRPETRS